MRFIRNIRKLLIKEEKNGTIEFTNEFKMPINEESVKELRNNKINDLIIQEYNESDGFNIFWWKDSSKKIGGKIKFNPSEFLLKNEPVLDIECQMDPEMDQELKYFRFLDVPTMNSQVGFFALPDKEPSKNLYFKMAGDKWASDLDLDVEGYLKMALVSRVFYYWQLVLIDIQNDNESEETKIFKKEMSKIFSDFNWNEFVNLYQSLRLSKRK